MRMVGVHPSFGVDKLIKNKTGLEFYFINIRRTQLISNTVIGSIMYLKDAIICSKKETKWK